MHRNCRHLPLHIVCKITQKNMKRANTSDLTLELVNEEIISDIHKHYQNLWKEHLESRSTLGSKALHTDTLWKTIHGYPAEYLPILNNSLTLNNK